MPRLKKHKSVSRIDQLEKHTHGWYVRVRFDGSEVAKFFPDKQAGGKTRSLQEALAFRDETEKRLGKPRTDRFVVGRGAGRKDVGVRLVIKKSYGAEGDVRESPVYEVTWSPEPNVLRRTSVSIRKHGKREALRMAREIRGAKEKLYYGPERYR